MKTSYFTYLRIFWDILYKIIFQFYKNIILYNMSQNIIKNQDARQMGGHCFVANGGAHILFSGKKCMKWKEIGLKNQDARQMGGRAPGAPPLDPPMINYANEMSHMAFVLDKKNSIPFPQKIPYLGNCGRRLFLCVYVWFFSVWLMKVWSVTHSYSVCIDFFNICKCKCGSGKLTSGKIQKRETPKCNTRGSTTCPENGHSRACAPQREEISTWRASF